MLKESGFLSIADHRLEYRRIGPRPGEAPTLVMLHEGLGCVGMWGDFPEVLQETTGCGVFLYSREGYGQSSEVDVGAGHAPSRRAAGTLPGEARASDAS